MITLKIRYDNNSRLLLRDTDSLMHEIETRDVYEDFSNDKDVYEDFSKGKDVYEDFSNDKDMFDFSNYSTNSKYYNNSN